MKKKGIGFQIDEQEHQRWRAAAKKTGRSLNGFIRYIVGLEASRVLEGDPKLEVSQELEADPFGGL